MRSIDGGLRVVVVFLTLIAATIVQTAPPPAPPKDAPPYEAAPRPNDGRQMALTVAALERGFDPPRPLRIWAIGSSFTNGLGRGELLGELLRQRFPQSPPLQYKAIAGNSTSYKFSHGWARHLVIPDQPDVVLLYNFGKTEDLEALIAELRRHTTADILVGSLHWCKPHSKLWPDAEAVNNHQDPPALRRLCEKYGVEFVENRRELTEYMQAHHLSIEDLLGDSVHQTRFAASATIRNIARHFHRPAEFAYQAQSRQRRVEVESANPVLRLGPGWIAAQQGEGRAATSQGTSLTLSFTGNRIELVGWQGPDAGSAEVWIDGKRASQADAYYATYLLPDKKNFLLPPNPPRDRAPHAIRLGQNLLPQQWTLTLVSDQADFELVGSISGTDGQGNGLKPFASRSGQILLDPDFWRDARNNRRGDRFTFEVVRATVDPVSFKADRPGKFRVRLADYMANGPHELKLVAIGDGPITLDALEVFEPPLK